jgi:chromosome segregation ATPase
VQDAPNLDQTPLDQTCSDTTESLPQGNEKDEDECYVKRREKILNILIDQQTALPRESRAAFYDFSRSSRTSKRSNGSNATQFSIEESLQLIEVVLNKEVSLLQKQYSKDIADVEHKAFELKEKLKMKVKQSFTDMVKEKEDIKSAAGREVAKLLAEIAALKKQQLELEGRHQREVRALQAQAVENRARLDAELQVHKRVAAERDMLVQRVKEFSSSLVQREEECNALRSDCREHASRAEHLLIDMSALRAEGQARAERDSATIADVRTQLSETSSSLHTRIAETTKYQLDIKVLQEETERVTEELRNEEVRRKACAVDAEAERSNVIKLRQELTALTQHQKDLTDANSNLLEKVNSLTTSLSTVEEEAAQLTASLQHSERINKEELSSMENSCANLVEELGCERREKALLEESNIELQKSVDYAVSQFQEYISLQNDVAREHCVAEKAWADKLLLQQIVNRGLQSSLDAAYDELERTEKTHLEQHLQLESQIEGQLFEITNARDDLKQSGERISSLEGDLSRSDDEMIALKSDLSELTATLEISTSNHASVVSKLEAELIGSREDLQQSSELVNSLETNILDSKNEISALQSRLCEVECETSHLTISLEETMAKHAAIVSSLERDISLSKAEVSRLEDLIKTLSTDRVKEMGVMENTIARLEAAVRSGDEKLEVSKSRVVSLENKLNISECEVAALSSQYKEAEDNNFRTESALKIRISELELDLQKSQDEVNSVSESLSSCEAEAATLRINVSGLQSEVAHFSLSLEESQAKHVVVVEKLEDQVVRLESEVAESSRIRDEVADGHAGVVAALKSVIAGLESGLRQAQLESHHTSNVIKSLEDELSQSNGELSALKTRIIELESDVSEMVVTLDKKTATHTRIVSGLEEELTDTRNDLQKSQECMGNLEIDLSASIAEISAKNAKIDELDCEVSHLTISLEETTLNNVAVVTGLRECSAALEVEVTRLKDQVELYRDQKDAEHERANALECDLDNSRRLASETNIRLEKANADALEVRSSFLQLQVQVEDAERNERAAKGQLESAIADMEAAQAQCGDLVAELCAATGSADSLEFDLAQKLKELTESEKSNVKLETSLAETAHSLETAEQNNSELNKVNRKQAETIESLEVELQNVTDSHEEFVTSNSKAIECMKSNIVDLTSELNDANDIITSLEKEIHVFGETISTLHGKIEKLESENSQLVLTLEETVTTHAGVVSEIEVELSSTQDKLRQSNQRVSVLESDFSTSEGEVTKLKARVSELTSSIEESASSHTNVVSDLEVEVTNTRAELRQLETDMLSSEGEVTALKTKVSDLEAAVTSTHDELQLSLERVSALEADLSKSESDVTTLTTTVAEITSTFDEAAAKHTYTVSEMEIKVANTNEELKLSRERVSALEASLSISEHEVVSTREELLQSTERSNVLESNLFAKIGELDVLKTRVNETEAEVSSTRDELQQTRDRVRMLESDLTTSESEVTTLTTRVSELTVTLDETVTHRATVISEMEVEMANTRVELQESRERVSALETDFSSSVSETTTLEARVSELTSTLDETIFSHTSIVSEVDKIRNELRQSCERVSELEFLLSTSESVVTTLKARVSELTYTLEETVSNNANVVSDMEVEMAKTRDELQQSREHVSVLESNFSTSESEVTTLKARVSELILSLEEVVANHASVVSDMEVEVANTREELQQCRERANVLESDFSASEGEAVSLKAKVLELSLSLEGAVSKHAMIVSSLENNIDAAEEESAGLRNELKDALDSLAEAEGACERWKIQANKLEVKLEREREVNAAKAEELLACSERVEELQAAVGELEDNCMDLTSQLEMPKQVQSDLEQQIIALQRELSKSEESVIDFEVSLMKSEASKLSLIEHVSTLQRQLGDIESVKNSDIAALEENILCLKMKIDIFLSEISSLKETLLSKEVELESVRRQCEELECDLDSSYAARDEEQAENKELIEVSAQNFVSFCKQNVE